MSGGGVCDLSPTTHRKGPLVTTVISERRMVSQCSSEGTAAPPEPKAAPRPSLCMVSSAAAPALVMKSHWASPRSSHEPVGATLTVETHMARGVRFPAALELKKSLRNALHYIATPS